MPTMGHSENQEEISTNVTITSRSNIRIKLRNVQPMVKKNEKTKTKKAENLL